MPNLSQFKLKRPCRHCPFRNDGTRIIFGARERAAEIEENAYREGFPCHETAECEEDPLTGEEGFVFGEDTSFCVGYAIMQLKMGTGPWPAIDNDDDFLEELSDHLGDWWNTAVFEDDETFFEANESDRDGVATSRADAEATESHAEPAEEPSTP